MRRSLLPIVVVVSLAAAGCSTAKDDTGVASLTETTTTIGSQSEVLLDAEEAMLDYTACLNEMGFDVEYPGLDADGNPRFPIIMGEMPGGDTDDPAAAAKQMDEQIAQCEHHIEGIVFTTGDAADAAEAEDKMLAYAQCMREQGIDIDDHDFSGDGSVMGLDADDMEKFMDADKACQKVFTRPDGDATG